MRASELILALQSIVAGEGDLDVLVHLNRAGIVGEPFVRTVRDVPICGDNCCHDDQIWL